MYSWIILLCTFLLTGDETQEMERSFHGSISGFALSAEYFACMFEGKIQLMQVIGLYVSVLIFSHSNSECNNQNPQPLIVCT